MTIDPRWSIFFSIALGIGSFVVAIPDWKNSGLDPTTVARLVWWLGVSVGAGNIVNAILTGIPAKDNQKGFIPFLRPAPQEPPKS